MAANILDQLLGATGFSTKIADENVREARDHTIGSPGQPGKGGLIPGMEAEIGYRDDYLDRFGAEKDRVLGQFDENRAQRGQINETALAQLPGIAEATTPEGYAARIDKLSGDPAMQRILKRQRQQRARGATNQLAAGGLTRSGAAGEAGAQNTLTNEEFAFQTEQNLFNRAMDTAGMYQDLPIANQMVADTLTRDLSIADNMVQQGMTRGQADLLMGQISKEGMEAMLENLLKVYAAGQNGGGPPINIINEISNGLTNTIGDLVDKGGGWLTDAVTDIVGGIFEDFNPGGAPDTGAGDVDVPAPGVPPVADAPAIETPAPPADLPEGISPEQWEEIKTQAPEGTADPDAWAKEVVRILRASGDVADAGGTPAAPVSPPSTEDTGIADPNAPVYGELPSLPDLGIPGLEGGIRDPGQEFEDLAGNIGDQINIGDVFKPGGGGVGSNFAPQPGSGGAPPPVALPGLGSMVLSEVTGYGGREIGEALFDRKATTSWGAKAGSAIGYTVGGPVGAAIGAAIGGVVDSALGTSDQKNVHVGVATTKPGDDISGEVTLPSGVKLWGINRRGGDGDMTQTYMDTVGGIDEFLTETAKAAGFDVNLSNEGFGGEVQGKGKDLRKNPTFFGSATEGSEKSDRAHITRNLTQGYDKFVDAWINAAVDQDQITGEAAEQLRSLDGDITQKLRGFQSALGFDVPDTAPDTPSPGANLPGIALNSLRF